METSPRTFLDAARFSATVLFWPILALVVWGELRLDVPTALQGINDKFLHFGAYLILGALAGGAIKQRGLLKWAVLGLIVFDAMIYFILHRRPAPLHRLSGQRGLAAEQAGRQIDNRQ